MQRSIKDIDIAIGPDEFSRSELRTIAQVADELGVRNLWICEGRGRDAFSVLNELAVHTDRINLGTGIVNVFSRTPTAIAQATASVMELMGSRSFNLGLGTSGKLLMQKYHGSAFAKPVSTIRETVRIIDHAFRTGNLPSDGTLFRLAEMPLGVATARDRLKIFVAGLSDPTIDVVGTLCDGWLPIHYSLRRCSVLLEPLDAAAGRAGRARPIVAPFLYGTVGADPSLREYTRDTLAWYVAAQGTAYRRLYEKYGYGEEVGAVCELWANGQRPQARKAFSDDLLEDTALVGPAEQVLDQVDRYIAAGVDWPILRVQSQPSAAQIIDMLAQLAAAG